MTEQEIIEKIQNSKDFFKTPKKLLQKYPQTEDICLAAVKKSGYLLEFIDIQTEKVCLQAVDFAGDVLKFVKNQTEEICLNAVGSDPSCLKFVNNQTVDICITALKRSRIDEEYPTVFKLVNIVDNPSHKETLRKLITLQKTKNSLKKKIQNL